MAKCDKYGNFYDIWGRQVSPGDIIVGRLFTRSSWIGKVKRISNGAIYWEEINPDPKTNEPVLIKTERKYSGDFDFIILEEPLDEMKELSWEDYCKEYVYNGRN